MKKIAKIEKMPRKRFDKTTGAPVTPGAEQARRDSEKKKGVRGSKPHRDQPAREHDESPRGSTIPPYPKPRIDD